MTELTVNDLYSVSLYRSEIVVEEKIEDNDFKVYVSWFEDDENMVPMIVGGHHALYAAIKAGIGPEIVIVKNEEGYTLEQYVIAFAELSNPEKLDGTCLW